MIFCLYSHAKNTNPAAELLCSGVRLCAETAEKPYFKRFSGIEKVHRNSIKITVDFWRRRWDLNPCAGYPTYSLSRGAPSPTWVLLHGEYKRKMWRRGRDSNSWSLTRSLVFKTSSLNHSDTSPFQNKWYYNTQSMLCQACFLCILQSRLDCY